MIIDLWFKKAERHIDVCDICFEIEDYPYIINSCFLAMYSCVKALFVLKNIECKTLEGLIYLFKITYVDDGLFDRNLFRFFCKTKELNTEFFRSNFEFFNEMMARVVFIRTKVFVNYSKMLVYENVKVD